MAHNLQQGRMAFVGEAPWHGLGTQVPPNINSVGMLRASGLDWKVSKIRAPGARPTEGHANSYDRYLVMREPIEDEKTSVALGMVGHGYEPLQNTKAFAFFEPLVNNKFAQFHTAGALGNGERVWVLAKLSENILVGKDDVVERYLLLSNSHNGSGAVSVRFTPIRVVCQNTLNYALKGGSGTISIRHTRNVERNLVLAQAEELKAIISKTFADAQTLFGNMALRQMKSDRVSEFLQLLFPKTDAQRKAGEEPDRWGRIRSILEDETVTPPSTTGTLWALYNAIIRDEDYRETREATNEKRLERVWFGSGQDLKLKILAASRAELRRAS